MHKLTDILQVHKDINGAGRGRPAVSRPIWERAVGSRIAKRAQPLKLQGGMLTIRVSNTSWANELSLLSEDIRKQLASAGLHVQKLRFVVGKLDMRHTDKRAQRRRAAPPKGVRPPPVVLRATASQEDSPLREAMEEAAGVALWLKKRHE